MCMCAVHVGLIPLRTATPFGACVTWKWLVPFWSGLGGDLYTTPLNKLSSGTKHSKRSKRFVYLRGALPSRVTCHVSTSGGDAILAVEFFSPRKFSVDTKYLIVDALVVSSPPYGLCVGWSREAHDLGTAISCIRFSLLPFSTFEPRYLSRQL